MKKINFRNNIAINNRVVAKSLIMKPSIPLPPNMKMVLTQEQHLKGMRYLEERSYQIQ
jgi:hypothetical protein